MSTSLIKVYLLPGDYQVGDSRYRIRTLLGSCVSITLWHPRLQVGAMSHFVLHGSKHEVGSLNARYGEDALRLMEAELSALGVKVAECQAKIFGGGAMFETRGKTSMLDIGRKNGEAARRMLLERNIPIFSESLFGEGHRQIAFNVKTGDVWVRQGVPSAVIQDAKRATA